MVRVTLALALVLMIGCSRDRAADSGATEGSSDSAAVTTMQITLSAEQVQHGSIAWEPAAAGSLSSSSSIPGQLVPNEDRTSRLGAPATGRVVMVRVTPGDRVAAGQVLVTLQSPDVAMAQAEVTRAQADLASRQSQASYAQTARGRAERLLALKAIPRQEYDRAVADDEQARAAVTQAEAELLRTRSTAEQLGSGSVSGEMLIRATSAGVVLTRTALPGAVVETGAPLVVVTDLSSLWLTINAPENLAGSFRTGDGLRFTVPAFPTDSFTARIEGVAPGLDPSTRTLAVRALVINTSGRLKPEMLAGVSLPNTGARSADVVLPADAVVMMNGKPVVFVAMPMGERSTMFTGRPVQLGPRSRDRVTIAAGLARGEVVVTRGAFAIKAALAKGAMPAMEM